AAIHRAALDARSSSSSRAASVTAIESALRAPNPVKHTVHRIHTRKSRHTYGLACATNAANALRHAALTSSHWDWGSSHATEADVCRAPPRSLHPRFQRRRTDTSTGTHAHQSHQRRDGRAAADASMD